MPKLKDKRREEFCQQYIIDFKGARAARDAGYGVGGARVRASKLLTEFNIQERLVELIKDRSERTQITQDMVLQELAALGFSNIKDYIRGSSGSAKKAIVFKNMDKISRKKASAIESIKVSEDGKVEFRLYNKPKSIEMIGRHLGMFLDKVEHSGELEHAVFIMPRPKDKK